MYYLLKGRVIEAEAVALRHISVNRELECRQKFRLSKIGSPFHFHALGKYRLLLLSLLDVSSPADEKCEEDDTNVYHGQDSAEGEVRQAKFLKRVCLKHQGGHEGDKNGVLGHDGHKVRERNTKGRHFSEVCSMEQKKQRELLAWINIRARCSRRA